MANRNLFLGHQQPKSRSAAQTSLPPPPALALDAPAAPRKLLERPSLPVLGVAFQALLHAARVGQMLIQLKAVTPHGEFGEKVQSVALLSYRTAANLMKQAKHLPLLEQHKPESQAAARRLHPPPPPAPAPSGLQSLLERVFAPRCRAGGD